MLQYPAIDPVALDLGFVKVHWYGLMYLGGFAGGWWLGRRRARDAWRGFDARSIDDLLFYIAIGVIVGGRLGYMAFYDFGRLADDPAAIVRVWQGGMSFHGGLIGVLTAMWLFARKTGRTFFQTTDFMAPFVPLGLGLGRIGNFINGNLWGKPSELPWAMVFPAPEAGGVPRHPSQLYEVLLEGVVLFVVLWLYSRKPRPLMAVSALFLLCYGAFRFAVEFLRVPDADLDYLALGWVTMGQVLSLPMVVAGAALLLIANARGAPAGEAAEER